MNRNKKSIALDLKTPGGLEAVRGLSAVSDVLIENYRVGALGKLGLGYEEVKALNPGIVDRNITGYGQTGPTGPRRIPLYSPGDERADEHHGGAGR